ncbi:hypothetical protein F8M41_011520 [Gigaspora margarita]|uniref:Uncharacterized protein n=1 Tax=Gigaspora margarita TaxID=4874 RepID=A0A8H3X0W6_GIGMA|nr:hypothetical protein F8M41_011520 [Gigaspora margarita]
MSNKPNNSFTKYSIKDITTSSQDVIQDSEEQINNDLQQSCLDIDRSQRFVESLGNIYNEGIKKRKNTKSILNLIDQFLIKNYQNPEEVIKLCLHDQTNPIIQLILGNFYYFGKWIEKDENKAFVHYQKSAELGNPGGMLQEL